MSLVTVERTHLLSDPAHWDWRQLRDYVVGAIIERGAQPDRDPRKERAIFERFVKTWGAMAGPIAVYVFTTGDGYWGGQPVTVNRFCTAADSYFAGPICLQILAIQEASGPLGS